MEIIPITKAGVPLVDPRPESWPYALFVTISPNPNTKHAIYKTINGKRTTVQIPYGKLPQKVQYDYCMRVVKSAYNISKDTKLFGIWELNKSGNVHFHMILTDPTVKGKTSLAIMQRDVLNSEIVMKNLSKKMIDYMNNIVVVNDSITERLEYMLKDYEENITIMDYYATKSAIVNIKVPVH